MTVINLGEMEGEGDINSINENCNKSGSAKKYVTLGIG